jgi:hypothetical protein
MIELTPEQQKQVDAGQAVEVTDAQTARGYVLLRKETFERLKGSLYDSSDAADDELRFLLSRAAAGNGWDEPGMDAYDRYDEELSKRCPE